jgi:hypothetical protein
LGGNVGEEKNLLKMLGYTAMGSAIIVGVIQVLLALKPFGEYERETVEYGLFAIFSFLPTMVAFQRGKSFFRVPSIGGQKGGKEDYELEDGEYIVLDTRPHRMYFLKLYIGIISAIILLIWMLDTYPIENYKENMTPAFLLISMLLASISHILLKNALKANRIMSFGNKFWSISFAVMWALMIIGYTIYIFSKIYPTQLWEKLIGIPSVSFVLLSLILFILSSVFWRIDMYLSDTNRGPIGAISITMILGGIALLFPPIKLIFSPAAITVSFLVFLTVDMLFVVSVFAFAIYRGGVRFIATNKRIISVKRFLSSDVVEYPYGNIGSIEVIRGFIGRKYDYGDLRIRFYNGKKSIYVTLHGIKNPELVKNSILSLSRVFEEEQRPRRAKSKSIMPGASIRYY